MNIENGNPVSVVGTDGAGHGSARNSKRTITTNRAESKSSSSDNIGKRFEELDIAVAAAMLDGVVEPDGSIRCPTPDKDFSNRSLHITASPTHPDGFICYAHNGHNWQDCRAHVIERLGLSNAPRAPLTEAELAKRAAEREAAAEAEAKRRETKFEKYEREWDAAADIGSDEIMLASLYLKRRGLQPPLGVLRVTSEGSKNADMLARIDDPVTGEARGFHKTFLTRPHLMGPIEKRYIALKSGEPVCRIYGGSSKGVIRLIEGAANNRTLMVGEGIETALSLSPVLKSEGATVWATGDCGNLGGLPVLEQFDELVIAMDVEPSGAGRKAADTCAARWVAAGKRVRLVIPVPPKGKDKFDLNDVLQDGPIEGGNYRVAAYAARQISQDDPPPHVDDGDGDSGNGGGSGGGSGNGGGSGGSASPPILDAKNPMSSARQLVADAFTGSGSVRTLHRYKGGFWSWTGSHYRETDDEGIRAEVWKFLDSALTTNRGSLVPFKPTSGTVSNVMDALNGECQLKLGLDEKGHEKEAPAWLTPRGARPKASELFACRNGLLDLRTRELIGHTPEFFGLNASGVIFDPEAPEPRKWLTFLDQLFGEDRESIELLQEWFGYLLSPDTSQHKILLVVGPKRSGKGTIGRVLENMVGPESVAGPTMGSLANQFGLEPLIAAPVAIVSDARIGKQTDKSTIVERLLSISGEDPMSVDRKHRKAWKGHLPTRFTIMTNELPSLNDGSGALAGRFMLLNMTQSFYGKEDLTLTDKLVAELSGILNWSIEGYRRLQKKGRFVQPASANEALSEIEMLGAPVKAFIHECCDLGPGLEVDEDALWVAFQNWNESDGRKESGSKKWFGRNLRTAIPGIGKSRRGSRGKQVWHLIGLALKPFEPPM